MFTQETYKFSKNYRKIHEKVCKKVKSKYHTNYQEISYNHMKNISIRIKIFENIWKETKVHFFHKLFTQNHYEYEDIHTFTHEIIYFFLKIKQKFYKTLKNVITLNLNL